MATPWLVQRLGSVRQRIKGLVKGGNHAEQIRRRRQMKAVLGQRLPALRLLLLLAGYTWMLLLPLAELSQGTYIDENALQPSQVNTYWDWSDVYKADRYLEQLDILQASHANSTQRAEFVATELRKMGLSAHTQDYAYSGFVGNFSGTNAYALSTSPRASGAEAIVISASWISRTDEGKGTPNLRGIATVLSLAQYLTRYSFWAKDLVFVISDQYMEGMHAWLHAYHHAAPQSNLHAKDLAFSPGVIWTAINVDYPGHSFSHLGIFHEGLNGRLPNQDWINSVEVISRHTGGVPMVLYDHVGPGDGPSSDANPLVLPSWIPESLSGRDDVKDYTQRLRSIVRHVGYQATGQGSGVHGLFHQYRVDAFTIFAVPADGPHGFHAIGRILESSLRTANNLLERLHASFFFYIMTGPGRFMKIGSYLPSVILVSVSMMFGGFAEYVASGWTQVRADEKHEWQRRARPVLKALGITAYLHFAGLCLFPMLHNIANGQYLVAGFMWPAMQVFMSLCVPLTLNRQAVDRAALSSLLKAFNLCLASTVITVVSLLNFSLAALLAVLLALPLSMSGRSASPVSTAARAALYVVLAVGWVLAKADVLAALRNWELYGAWFAPFVCAVYVPLVMQALTATLL